jgi:uncharacterized OB-fold protein
LPIIERINSSNRIHEWRDSIALHYEHTAGVAGEKFLRGLIEGRLVGGRCDRCEVTFLPAKIYCVKCFGRIETFVDVPAVGRVAARSSGRSGMAEVSGFAFVTFEGVQGGLVHHLVEGAHLRIGGRARVRFKPKGARKGSILDIEGFEPA